MPDMAYEDFRREVFSILPFISKYQEKFSNRIEYPDEPMDFNEFIAYLVGKRKVPSQIAMVAILMISEIDGHTISVRFNDGSDNPPQRTWKEMYPEP